MLSTSAADSMAGSSSSSLSAASQTFTPSTLRQTEAGPLPLPLPVPVLTPATSSLTWAGVTSLRNSEDDDEEEVNDHDVADEVAEPASIAAAAADTRPLCTFFMAGSCRFGSTCRFRHEVAAPEAVDYFEAALRRARDGEGVGAADPIPASAACLSVTDAAFEAASASWLSHVASSSPDAVLLAAVAAGVARDTAEAETALIMAERNVSSTVDCSVCLERVTSHPGRRFGLLTGCCHAFCLECIREWRARIDVPVETSRSCPVCRTLSYLVIPCERFVADERRKVGVVSAFRASSGATPCRNYALGKGTCAFGSSCMYAHLLPDGTPAVLPKHTVRVGGDGAVGVTRAFKLNEFLF